MVENKNLNYNRDDVYIISLNRSSDIIEETKIQCYNDPIKIYEYFARIEACYDKSWKYMEDSKEMNKTLDELREQLFNKKLLKDIQDKSNISRIDKFLNTVLPDLTQFYRDMTSNYIKVGLFPKFYVESGEVGAVREAKHN